MLTLIVLLGLMALQATILTNKNYAAIYAPPDFPTLSGSWLYRCSLCFYKNVSPPIPGQGCGSGIRSPLGPEHCTCKVIMCRQLARSTICFVRLLLTFVLPNGECRYYEIRAKAVWAFRVVLCWKLFIFATILVIWSCQLKCYSELCDNTFTKTCLKSEKCNFLNFYSL